MENYTAEALAVDSPLIVTAEVVASDVRPGEWHGKFALRDVLKHPTAYAPPAVFDATLNCNYAMDRYRMGDEARLKVPPAGSRVLLFLAIPSLPPPEIEVYDCVNLDAPGAARSLLAPAVYDLTLKPVASGTRVREVVQSELRRVPPATATVGVMCYPMTPAVVPDDDRLIPLARGWVKSENPLARCMAVQIFTYHRDPQDSPALRSLLDDPFVGDRPEYLSPWSGREYLVRFWAGWELEKRGGVVPAKNLELPLPGLYEPVSWWWLGLMVVLPWVLFGWFRHRRRRRLGRTSSTRAVASYVTFVCLALAAVAALCWYRSMHTADNVVYARHAFILDITSIHGNVVMQWGRPWPGETPLVHAAITPDPADSSLLNRNSAYWNGFGTTTPDNMHSLWDIYIRGYGDLPRLIDGDLSWFVDTRPIAPVGKVPPCRGFLVACAYPYLLGMLLAFPAARVLFALLRAAWRKRRAARIARMGLCPQCSYDLRAHGSGQRCPECGRVIDIQPVRCVAEK